MRKANGVPAGTAAFKPVRLGAGGFTTGFGISNDAVTKVVRIDVFGAYIKSTGDAIWRQAFNTSTLAVGDCPNTAGYVAPSGTLIDGPGCFEIVVAPNDNQRLYAVWNARLWKSTNAGASWTHLTLADFNAFANSGNQPHNCGPNMAVDPQNHDVFLLGTSANGLSYSTNGGTTITNVALGANGTLGGWQMPSKVACDPTGSVVSTVKQRWFAVRQGTGVYVSTTGPGGPYTLMTGSPTYVSDMMFDASGNCWAVDPSNTTNCNLWKCVGTTWTRAPGSAPVSGSGQWQTIAADPLTSGAAVRVVAVAGGTAVVSSDTGSTWSGLYYPESGLSNIYALTLPWLGEAPWGGPNVGAGATIRFDPVTSNKLWAATGVGLLSCQAPTTYNAAAASGRFDWQESAEGIESMVATGVVEPIGGSPIFGVWDQGAWRMNDLNHSPRNSQRATSGAFGIYGNVQACWDIGVAYDNPNYVVGLINFNSQVSGYSTDGWQTVNAFPATPPMVLSGGSICVGNQNNILVAPVSGGGVDGRPYYTKNGGTTWSYVNIAGMPTADYSGFGTWGNFFNRKICAYDGLAGKFYMANYGPSGWTAGAGIWSTADLAAAWTQVHSGAIWGASDTYHCKLRWVPGQQGHFFFCAGGDQVVPFKRSTDGCVTFSSVPNVTQVTDFAIGKAAPGQSYPAIYFYGYLSGVLGLYRSDDNFATTPLLLSANPGGIVDELRTLGASPNSYGRVYVGYAGSSFIYGNYELKLTVS